MDGKDPSNTVYVKRLEAYDREALREIIQEGMRELRYEPRGKVFVKPNVVVAHRPELLGDQACTPRELVGAAMLTLAEQEGVERVDLGENSSMGFPTRTCMRYAGYFEELKELKKRAPRPVDIFCIDEERRDPVFVGGMVHDILRVSRKMARADTKVYLPKLKCHCVTNITATVKLNIGICSDDERSIRHDFLLNEKIVDLLSVGYPDFTIMDAVEIGVGNEGFPIMRKLGLVMMSRNPIAIDMIGARILGYETEEIPYLKRAIERGYNPASIDEVAVAGDLKSLDDVDRAAQRIQPYDDDFYQWQDIHKELERLSSPMRFYWGPYRDGSGERCKTGCVMGLKMFLASLEKYAGADALSRSKPAVLVIGKVDEEIDAKGADAFLFGSCTKAKLKDARKVVHLDKCFTTSADMSLRCGGRLGVKSPMQDSKFALPLARGVLGAAARKWIHLRYPQDIAYFVAKKLERRV
jgi:uncharacterized protein (DUF362 family)